MKHMYTLQIILLTLSAHSAEQEKKSCILFPDKTIDLALAEHVGLPVDGDEEAERKKQEAFKAAIRRRQFEFEQKHPLPPENAVFHSYRYPQKKEG